MGTGFIVKECFVVFESCVRGYLYRESDLFKRSLLMSVGGGGVIGGLNAVYLQFQILFMQLLYHFLSVCNQLITMSIPN